MLILAALILLAAPASAQPSPSPSPSPTPSPSSVVVDPAPGLVDRMLDRVTLGVRDGMREWWEEQMDRSRQRAAERVQDALRNAEELLITPDVREQERVRHLETAGRFVAGAVLAVLLALGIAMLSAGDRVLAAKELIPRVFVAAAAAILGGALMSTGIDLANGLLAGFLGGDAGVLSASASRILLAEGAGWVVMPFLYVTLGLAMFALGVLRVALLIVLAASGPLVQAGWAMPQTDSWARTWWRMLAALLLAPVAQAFLLKLASWVFFTGGEFGWSGAAADAIVLLVLMVLMVVIPIVGLKIALGPALSGMGRLARAARARVAMA